MYFSETYKYRNICLCIITDLSIDTLILIIIPQRNLHNYFIKSKISICFQTYIMISSHFGLLELYSEMGRVKHVF